jgi:hypothetical protein
MDADYKKAIDQASKEGHDGYVMESRAVEILKEKGFDGATYKDMSGPTWIAFSPTQIKSATGNKGSFDSDDPIITHTSRPTGDQ